MENTNSKTGFLASESVEIYNQILDLSRQASEIDLMLDDISSQSADIDLLFIQLAEKLEKNAAAPAPVVPTPPGSQRPDSQNADNAVYRHQSIFEKDQVTTNLHCRWCDVPDWHYPLNEDDLCSECAALSDLGLTPVDFAGLNKIDCEGNLVPFSLLLI